MPVVFKDCVFVSTHEAKPWVRPWMFTLLGLGSHRVAPERPGAFTYQWRGTPPGWLLRWLSVPRKYEIPL